jgi:hypothetical protein
MKKTGTIALLAVVAASGAWAQTTTSTTSLTRDLGLAGLAATETAQIFVVNTAPASSSGTAASCAGSLSFTNAAGTAIGTAVSFTLGTGQSSVATLPYAQAGQSGRAVISAHLTLTRTTGSNPPCSLRTLFETFDTTTGRDACTYRRWTGSFPGRWWIRTLNE